MYDSLYLIHLLAARAKLDKVPDISKTSFPHLILGIEYVHGALYSAVSSTKVVSASDNFPILLGYLISCQLEKSYSRVLLCLLGT
jgi:hypothetical protein